MMSADVVESNCTRSGHRGDFVSAQLLIQYGHPAFPHCYRRNHSSLRVVKYGDRRSQRSQDLNDRPSHGRNSFSGMLISSNMATALHCYEKKLYQQNRLMLL